MLDRVDLPNTTKHIGNWSYAHCDLWDGVSFCEDAEVGTGAFHDTANGTRDGFLSLTSEQGIGRFTTFGEHCPQAIVDKEYISVW